MSTLKFKDLNFSKQEFRLLEIHPASNVDQQLSCKLVTVSLNDDPEFIALSTLYGDGPASSSIVINNQAVQVTEQLDQALRHVRAVFFPSSSPSSNDGNRSEQTPREKENKKTPRWLVQLMKHVRSILPSSELDRNTPLRLWNDVLCLDPQEDRENIKLLLSKIYGSAKMVIGWLGMKVDSSDAALRVLKEVDDAMPPRWGDVEDRALHPENYAPQHDWAKKIEYMWLPTPEGVSPFHRDYWVGAHDFMNRPYFQRRWILEEISLARFPAFLIGDTIVSWRQVLRLNKCLEEFKDNESYVCPPEVRSQIYDDLPLGTVHALLDEFERRTKLERLDALNNHSESSEATKTSHLAPYSTGDQSVSTKESSFS